MLDYSLYLENPRKLTQFRQKRPLIIGQINGNEFIFSIKYNPALTPAKREALEKKKGLKQKDVIIEPTSDIDWEKIRQEVRRFLFLRLEMFRP